MEPITADISIKGASGTAEVKATRMRFSSSRCFAFDKGVHDRRCLAILGEYLKSKNGLALYRSGRFFDYLLDNVHDLKNHVKAVIEDNASGNEARGIKSISPDALPPEIKTVFLCETLTVPLSMMRKKLSSHVEVITPSVLKELDWRSVPERSWIPCFDSIYEIDIPEIKFLPGQDLILIDCPSRNMALMPNGLAYVHNALKESGLKFQTLDLDVILYHRYHTYRLMDSPGRIITDAGYEMPEDPWLAEYCEEWSKKGLIDFFRPEINEIVAGLIKAAPKILALSLQACNLAFSREIVNKVKSALPETVILVGGYSCYQPSIGRRAFPESDYMIIGEADLTVGPLAKRLAAGERPSNVPGVFSRFDSPDYVFKQGETPQDLDSLKMPTYDWFKDIGIYRNHNHYRLTPIIASRGCRWSRCNFCAERLFWRCRSPKSVVDEFEWLADRGCDQFMFNESDLNGSIENLQDICDEIVRRKLRIRLSGQLRIHKDIDRAFFDRLSAAGFISLRFGVDAWTENTLRLQKKGYTQKVITQNLKACHEAGIYTEVNTVIGVPGETDDDIRETIEVKVANKSYIGRIASLNPLVLFIGSIYWDEPEKFNILFREDKKKLYFKYPSVIPSNLWYSVNPYIDEVVRQERFKTIVLGLHKNGFDLSDYARKVVEDVLSGKGAEKSARPDADEFQSEEEKKKLVPAAAITVTSTGHRVVDDHQGEYLIFKYGNDFYRLADSDKFNLKAINRADVKKAGPVVSFMRSSADFTRSFIGKWQTISSNPGRIAYYAGRSVRILKNEGFAALMDRVKRRVGSPRKDYFTIEASSVAKFESKVPVAMHMICGGFNGYNIIKAGSYFYGIKHGYPFDIEKADAGEYDPALCIKGGTIKAVESSILKTVTRPQ